MTSFAVIDFEWADSKDCRSICQIGYALVDDGKIRSDGMLVHPYELKFNYYCTAKHGITADDVRERPRFPVLWPAVQELLRGRLVFAHQASADRAKLLGTTQAYQMTPPSFDLACSKELSQAVWPKMPGYGLEFLAKELGVHPPTHSAEHDSRACAEIVLGALNHTGESCVVSLCERFGITRMPATDYSSTKRRSSGSAGVSSRSVVVRVDKDFDTESHPLHGKNVLITGTVHGISKAKSGEALEALGATPMKGWSTNVDVLVEGTQDPKRLKPGEKYSEKMRKALAYREHGNDIAIISQAEFKQLLSMGTDYGG